MEEVSLKEEEVWLPVAEVRQWRAVKELLKVEVALQKEGFSLLWRHEL